jgi:hypothetical protein
MEYSYAQSQGMPTIFWLILLATYAYFAFSIQIIANKTGTPNGWMAWVPILNAVLLCNIGDKPIWWVLLMFIPLVNFVITVMLWMAVSEARQKSPWLGILMILPFLNLIIPGYLAFSE